MERKILVGAIFFINIIACLALPQQQLRHIKTNVDDVTPFIIGEGLVSADLKIKPIISVNNDERQQTNYIPYNGAIEENAKSENDPVDFESADQLIQNYQESEKITDQTDIDKRTTLRLPSGGSLNVASANPIYITIPISINKAPGTPMRLTVGGQEIPLPNTAKTVPQNTGSEPLSPTSQFNRLLLTDSPQTKRSKHSSRKIPKRKKSHRKNGLYSSKSHSRKHKEKIRKTLDLKDNNQNVNYRFYF